MSIVLRSEAERFAEQVVPCGGHLGHADLAVQQHPLDAEAQDDMEVVGGLIRLHPDRGELGALDVAEEFFQRESFELGEVSLCHGIEFLPECPGATHMVFPEA